ncbi:MAG: hypothetical protein IJ017_00940 [Oscillospiraceae bacterium]|nr:hypothetical protein [Oscillospiraceae bacterium]
MKKIIITVLSIALIIVLGATAYASATCSVSADTVTATAGQQVTVPVRIADNTGFTNFAVILDYDRTALELVSINTASGEESYLCGELVSVNTVWENGEGETFGYITCALSEKCSEDGILFTATFNVKSGFSGTASVTPSISYIRNNAAVFSVFEEITANVHAGSVNVEKAEITVRIGDVNGDGKINAVDAALTYKYVNNKTALTEEQLLAADVNGDGKVNAVDAALIYKYVNNKLDTFPAEN